jgi:ATP/maltotriose-dependent transcriptional regulator MalT
MVEHGQVDTMRSWLAGFSDAQIEGHAPLAIAAAWVSGFAGERDRAVRFAEAARLGHWDGDMPDGTASLESALAIMCAALGLGGVSGMHAAAQRAVELEPPTSPWRTGALVLLGEAEVLGGDFTAARSTLEEAVKLTVGKHASGATSLAYLAFAELQLGHVKQALLHVQRAHAIVEQPGMAGHMPNISTYSVLAYMLSQRGDLEGSAQAVQRASELLPRLTDAYWWQMSFARILLPDARAGRCSPDRAGGTHTDDQAGDEPSPGRTGGRRLHPTRERRQRWTSARAPPHLQGSRPHRPRPGTIRRDRATLVQTHWRATVARSHGPPRTAGRRRAISRTSVPGQVVVGWDDVVRGSVPANRSPRSCRRQPAAFSAEQRFT